MEININRLEGTKRVREAGNQALTDVRDLIVDDMNQYVPISGGDAQNGGGGELRRSAELHSTFAPKVKNGRITIRWDTPYAQYQHGGLVMKGSPKNRSYGPEKLNYTSSMARAEWEQYAEQQHGKDWTLQIEKRMTNYL